MPRSSSPRLSASLSSSLPFSFHLLCCLFLWLSEICSAQHFILQQGVDQNNQPFVFSPYILWNTQVNPNPSPLNTPLQVYSSNGLLDITLEVKTSVVENELFSYATRTFCYNSMCGVPGPTIYCNPGDKLIVRLVNRLENSSAPSEIFADEVFFPNRTNFFVQGLALDPAQNSPFRYNEGNGATLVYEHDIPRDVQPGLFSYHSRVHGLAALHMAGGLFGALMIYPHNTTTYASAFSKVFRQTVVLSHAFPSFPAASLPLPGTTSGRFSFVDEDFLADSLSLSFLSRAMGSRLPLGLRFSGRFFFDDARPRPAVPLFDAWLANGQFQPALALQPGQWQVLDILVASADRLVELELSDSFAGQAGVGRSCRLSLLGKDGLAYSRPRTDDAAVGHLVLQPSETASLLVMCPQAGRYFLVSNSSIGLRRPEEFGGAAEGRRQVGDHLSQSVQLLLTLEVAGDFFVMDEVPADLSFLPATDQVDSAAAATPTPAASLSLATAQQPGQAALVLGAGADCVLPCYNRPLCSALYGRDDYSLADFPAAQAGRCSFASSSRAGVGSQPGNGSSAPAAAAAEGAGVPGLVVVDFNVTATDQPAYVAIELFGHVDFPRALRFQTAFLQLRGFEAVDGRLANIVGRDEYRPSFAFSPSFFYRPGDWQPVFLALPGRTSLSLKLLPPAGGWAAGGRLLWVLATALKFEDRGLLRAVLFRPTIVPPAPLPAPSPAPSPAPISPTAPFPSVAESPAAVRARPDGANETFFCDPLGADWFFAEAVDAAARARVLRLNSCPNHFSACQSRECGGLKTRALVRAEEVRLPLFPRLRARPVDMSCAEDRPVAVALNGVKIYAPAEAARKVCRSLPPAALNASLFGRTRCQVPSRPDGILVCGDKLRAVATAVDRCGGYVAGSEAEDSAAAGEYKYLGLPTCLLAQQTAALAGQLAAKQLPTLSNLTLAPSATSQWLPSALGGRLHSPQLGWAVDGFPLYGPLGPKGVPMRPCGSPTAHPQLCLDKCNGEPP